MNRLNIKITILFFLVAAGGIWLIGHVRYSKARSDEIDCWNQQMEIYNSDKTNSVIRQSILDASEETLTNADSDPAERRLAITEQEMALDGEKSELDAEQVWIDKRQAFADQRQHAQSQYSRAAVILSFPSLAFTLLLFITNPKTKTKNGKNIHRR